VGNPTIRTMLLSQNLKTLDTSELSITTTPYNYKDMTSFEKGSLEDVDLGIKGDESGRHSEKIL
jgi:hypothetical protein